MLLHDGIGNNAGDSASFRFGKSNGKGVSTVCVTLISEVTVMFRLANALGRAIDSRVRVGRSRPCILKGVKTVWEG